MPTGPTEKSAAAIQIDVSTECLPRSVKAGGNGLPGAYAGPESQTSGETLKIAEKQRGYGVFRAF